MNIRKLRSLIQKPDIAFDYEVVASTYSCGGSSRRPLQESDIIIDHANRQVVILAEDN